MQVLPLLGVLLSLWVQVPPAEQRLTHLLLCLHPEALLSPAGSCSSLRASPPLPLTAPAFKALGIWREHAQQRQEGGVDSCRPVQVPGLWERRLPGQFAAGPTGIPGRELECHFASRLPLCHTGTRRLGAGPECPITRPLSLFRLPLHRRVWTPLRASTQGELLKFGALYSPRLETFPTRPQTSPTEHFSCQSSQAKPLRHPSSPCAPNQP